MAYSSLYPHQKLFGPFAKRSDAILKSYKSADPRVWQHDAIARNIGLEGVLMRDYSFDDDTENSSNEELVNKIKKLFQEIKKKDEELDMIHALYKETSHKLKTLEEANKSNQEYEILLKESQEEIQILKESKKNHEGKLEQLKNETENWDSIKERSDKYDEVVQERDAYKNQLCNLIGVENLLKKLKSRADKADQMEDEISKLKKDLYKCGHGASGDKIRTDQLTHVDSESQCIQCQRYKVELRESKSLLELEEKKCVDMEAERNFLRERARMIEVMEAELILYKTKYEDYECKLTKLKEMLIKSEINEHRLKDCDSELKNARCQLQASEQEHQNLIGIIERLDTDVRERDIYINSINDRISFIGTTKKKSLCFGEVVSEGKVQSMVKKLSSEITAENRCKCNIENCKCDTISKSSSIFCKDENLVAYENLASSKSIVSISPISNSEYKRLREEISSDEVRYIRMENEELNREVERLKQQLCKMSIVIDEFERERVSNHELERHLSLLQINHSRDLESVSSNYRSSLCQKMSELQTLEQKLNCEMENANMLEKKVSKLNEEVNELREFRKSCELIDECHCDKLKELEKFKCEYEKSQEENRKLVCEINDITAQIEMLKCKQSENENFKQQQCDQRDVIKNSIIAFKKQYEEKAQMIKSYEKKIRMFEAENESLKCFRDKFLGENVGKGDLKFDIKCEDLLLRKVANFGIDSLTIDELIELHDRVKCSLMKVSRDCKQQASVNYSRMIEELCQKYKLNLSKDSVNYDRDEDKNENFSPLTITIPRTSVKISRRNPVKKNRSKSNQMTRMRKQ